MSIDPQPTWASTLAALPKVGDTSWALNFANWYAARIVGIAPSPSALVAPGFVFTFNSATFASNLQTLAPTASATAGITGFADAWLAAMNASVAVVAPGAFKPPSTPATLFSVVASTLIDPASKTAARAKLLELITAPAVADPLLSQFPVKFRAATLLLTITVAGTNSVTPTPAPLTVPAVPLV